MMRGASNVAVMEEPPTEARDIIATCRAAWGTAYYASQSKETGVDEALLA
jgi:hypothetical protein